MKNVKRIALTVVFLIFAAAALLPLDMYIQKPGGAYDLSPLVEVEDGDLDDEGSLSLMTIALSKATPLTYAFSTLMDSRKVMKAGQVRRDGETEEEYNLRQLQLMEDSQINAIYVAYNRAGKPVTLETEGVLVLDVVEGSAADGILKAGDLITGVEEEPVDSTEGFAETVASVPEGDAVRLTVLRDDEEMTEEISPGTIPGTGGRKGLGVSYTAKRIIETDPEVEIETEDIGGPSAGLMFTLEIMNQLLDEDLTKGYEVAGTGEMNEDGTVGRIGGIDFKVMAADREGIEIFFAPDDEITGEMKERIPDIRSNYEIAAETAEKIGTDMKIVPVKTIDDALDYLDTLDAKPE